MEEGIICEECWSPASGECSDTSCPRVRNENWDKGYRADPGGHGAPRVEVRHSSTEADSPRARPQPSWQAWPLPTPGSRGPVDHSLSASSHPAPTGSKSLGKGPRVNVVQSWDHGILTWDRARILSLQTLSGDGGRAFRDPHPCLRFPL